MRKGHDLNVRHRFPEEGAQFYEDELFCTPDSFKYLESIMQSVLGLTTQTCAKVTRLLKNRDFCMLLILLNISQYFSSSVSYTFFTAFVKIILPHAAKN
jgi:hypothetical protein